MTSIPSEQPDYEIALLEHYLDEESYRRALAELYAMVEQGVEPELAFLTLTKRDPIV